MIRIENIVSFGLNTNSSSLAHLSDTLERDLNRFDRYAETKWFVYIDCPYIAIIDVWGMRRCCYNI